MDKNRYFWTQTNDGPWVLYIDGAEVKKGDWLVYRYFLTGDRVTCEGPVQGFEGCAVMVPGPCGSELRAVSAERIRKHVPNPVRATIRGKSLPEIVAGLVLEYGGSPERAVIGADKILGAVEGWKPWHVQRKEIETKLEVTRHLAGRFEWRGATTVLFVPADGALPPRVLRIGDRLLVRPVADNHSRIWVDVLSIDRPTIWGRKGDTASPFPFTLSQVDGILK